MEKKLYLEQRVEALEKENEIIRQELDELRARGTERFVTVKQLAEVMNVSVSQVHRKVKNGEIRSTRKLGDVRIPMSQFMEAETPAGVIRLVPREEKKKELSIKEQIFGD